MSLCQLSCYSHADDNHGILVFPATMDAVVSNFSAPSHDDGMSVLPPSLRVRRISASDVLSGSHEADSFTVPSSSIGGAL